MLQHIVSWGKIGTDRNALIAIELKDEDQKVHVYVIPQEEANQEIQDQLFKSWRFGGEFKFPENVIYWELDISPDIQLPKQIKLEKPETLTRAYQAWLKKLHHRKIIEQFQKDIQQLKDKVQSYSKFSPTAWEEAKSLWNSIQEVFKANKLPISERELLKIDINEVFDSLKALKRIEKEGDYEISLINFKALKKKIKENYIQLVDPNKWNSIFENLKAIHQEVKDLPLVFKHKKALFKELDATFDKLKEYRQTERQNHTKKRIESLQNVVRKIQKSIDIDKKRYKEQFEKMVIYTKGKLSEEEIHKRLKDNFKSPEEKLKKIEDIQKTIQSLEKKLNKKQPSS